MSNLKEKDILIWLNNLKVNNKAIETFLDLYSDLREILRLNRNELLSIKYIEKDILFKIADNREENQILNLISQLEKKEIRAITILDDDYPKSLFNINDKPLVLYEKGKMEEKDSLSIGIVGARKSTAYGQWACEKFTKELVNMDITIVSGLALGIDAIAHKTALENGGRTIAILGNGIDEIYPSRNSKLYESIVENGALLSEFPVGTLPFAYNFPQRNRIISGLSLAIIVIEAKEKSGSLITAHHALEQGKDIFALPGNINSIYSGGTNKLIKDGAIPLLEIDDILNEIKELNELKKEKSMKEIDISNLSESERRIIEAIKNGPIHCDMIAYKTRMPISTVKSTLTILEIKELAKEVGNQIFVLN